MAMISPLSLESRSTLAPAAALFHSLGDQTRLAIELDCPSRLGPFLGGRRPRQRDRYLAVHRLPHPFGDRGGPSAEGGCDQLLAARALCRYRVNPEPAYPRDAADNPARDRPH